MLSLVCTARKVFCFFFLGGCIECGVRGRPDIVNAGSGRPDGYSECGGLGRDRI
ncbi:unnamed protein product [Staurois parvus]|uniref:Uncharacterized protein n=1 Tax=Staurois parvus TaxID=386267 RepID=A0ABN9ESV3_9NEOB|nr:unnamed protein product [Staurois parvus]